jgi:flagellar biosynthetic protein FlhB
MAEESDLERSEAPSPRRLEQAREEGQVARSQDLTAFAVLLAGTGGLWFAGERLFTGAGELMARSLRFDAGVTDPQRMTAWLARDSFDAWLLAGPLLLPLAAVALLAPMGLSGWLLTARPLEPNFSRLNPLEGFKRMCSAHALGELAKALAKALLIGSAGALVIWVQVEAYAGLAGRPLPAAVAATADLVLWGVAVVVGTMLLIVAADVPLQLWQHYSRLRMSREDLRKEMRETEGDPHVKAAVRGQQRQMARRRMMAEVPRADVVVTNPSHYAVALAYAEGGMQAPRVVAKGADLVAARIREIAAAHRVPVLESPPLARALYRHAEIGEEIPEALYTAVAEVLAYVFQLRRHRGRGGAAPRPPGPVAVPPGLDPAEGRR